MCGGYLLLHGGLPTAPSWRLRRLRVNAPCPRCRSCQAPLTPTHRGRPWPSSATRDNSLANIRKTCACWLKIPWSSPRATASARPAAVAPPAPGPGRQPALHAARQQPAPHEIRALDVSLILYSNTASTPPPSAARVVISTPQRPQRGHRGHRHLAGPLHGGQRDAMHMLMEIGGVEQGEPGC